MAKSTEKALAAQPKHLNKKERLVFKLMELVPDGGKYKADVRIEALNYYAGCGSMKATAEHFGIPRTTMIKWTESAWWHECLELIMEQRHKKLEARWLGAQEKAMDLLEDNLARGEETLLKDGTTTRVQVGALTAAKVAAVAQDKRTILIDKRKGITIDGSLQGVDKLVALANAFAKVAKVTQDGGGQRIIDVTAQSELLVPTDTAEEFEDGNTEEEAREGCPGGCEAEGSGEGTTIESDSWIEEDDD